MGTPVIGFDIDGVLADFMGPYAELIEDRQGKKISKIAHRYDWFLDHGVTPSEHADNVAWWDTHPEWWYNIPSLPGVDSILKTLDHTNMDVYFLTQRPLSSKRHTEMWLQERWVECPTVLHTHAKGSIVLSLGITDLIDDRPENCIDVYHTVCDFDLPCKVSLLAAPYNTVAQDVWKTCWPDGDGIQVVKSLSEWFEALPFSLVEESSHVS